ncbi:Krueppel-like factor 15 [Grifola frondosa]|uniref:Krueppel-like factor 15 n=1 Tax=Grifola frondosa TaxID=5627 RepID=A0A1C7M4I3_GRIFR|nr:Krueppel-like factor 15 [Grifola frondosa]
MADYYLNGNGFNYPVVSTLEFRVPLLSGPVELDTDFQSNASGVPPHFQIEATWDRSPTLCRSPLSGLGIRCDGPLSLHVSDGTTMFGNASRMIDSLPQTMDSHCSSQVMTEAEKETLSLHDICHLDSPTDRGNVDHLAHLSKDDIRADPVPSLNADTAYSECPTTEFTAATARSPPPSSSFPCLSFGSNSGSESSLDGLGFTPSKYAGKSFLRLSSSPSCAEGNAAIGIYADVNMRFLAQEEGPIFGVNPADVMGNISNLQLSSSPNLSADLPGEVLVNTGFSDEAISAIMSVLSAPAPSQADVKLEDHAKLQAPLAPVSVHRHEVFNSQGVRLQSQVPTTNVGPPTVPFIPPGLSLSYPNASRSPLVSIQVPQVQALPTFPAPGVPAAVDSQSPVLNAHQGIDLADLRRRADDFRQRNPGMELDKVWLQAYAGRLSQRGELIEDYRCYVVGCGQRNKRRDHILVHVGSHVEHRPWQCGFCGMRFLRKNECKRHESSHGGTKPFSCPICAPFQERCFVRQDLLKRHMRVSHGVQSDPAEIVGNGRR